MDLWFWCKIVSKLILTYYYFDMIWIDIIVAVICINYFIHHKFILFLLSIII